jgi:hydrogenase expression/formation protein HypD
VFEPRGGCWRGIARVPNGNLRLRERYAHFDARQRFPIDLSAARFTPSDLAQQCRCGDIMAGIAAPLDCALFGKACTPESPVGACMVSSEGTCKIWHQYGGHPRLAASA